MVMDFYYASGSPYAWRVWLAFEHKNMGYDLRVMSFDSGDLEKPDFLAINPRHKVPAIVDRGFALYESAAILEYLESVSASSGGRLFPVDSKQRATARRMICECDQYVAKAMESLADEVLFTDEGEFDDAAIHEARNAFASEMQQFERYAPAKGFLTGSNPGAVDFTLYPMIALVLRMERKKKDLNVRATIPQKLTEWMKRFEELPIYEKTYPPHWKR